MSPKRIKLENPSSSSGLSYGTRGGKGRRGVPRSSAPRGVPWVGLEMGTLWGTLALLLLLRGCESATTTASAAAGAGEEGTGLPLSEMTGGFLYTRARGRCTPQFWSAREEAWPTMIPQAASVWKIFGSPALERYEPELTVLDAMGRNGGSAFSELVKQSSAALLNAYAREGFPYTPWEVKTLLLQALVSEEAAASQATRFADVNRRACV